MNRKERRAVARKRWHNGIRGKRMAFRYYWRKVWAKPQEQQP